MATGIDVFVIFLSNQMKNLHNNTLVINCLSSNLKTAVADYFFYKIVADKINKRLKELESKIKNLDDDEHREMIELWDELIEAERIETSYYQNLRALGLSRNAILYDMDSICFLNGIESTFGVLSRLGILSKEVNAMIKEIYP
jgi:hypothetical protein